MADVSSLEVGVSAADRSGELLTTFLSEQWLPAIKPTVRQTTWFGYRLHVIRHISPRIGHLPLREITPSILNELYRTLLKDGRLRRQGALTTSTVRRIHATLRRALRDATRWGFIESNPAVSSDPPRETSELHRQFVTWTAEELRRFLDHVRLDAHHPLWFLLGTTGLRRGEAVGLLWKNVDLERRQLFVVQTKVTLNGEVLTSAPKSARGRRIVALDRETVEILRKQEVPSAANGDEFVFQGAGGGELHPSWVSKRFKSLVDQTDLPKIRLHDLRHTHATLALEAGIHPKIVSERLGHASVSFTLDVYSHATQHLQAEAADKLAGMLFGIG